MVTVSRLALSVAFAAAFSVAVCSAQALVRDLNPASTDLDAFPTSVGPLTARACFAVNGTFSSTTWVTDGTAQGTSPAGVPAGSFTLGDRIYYLSGGQLRRSLATGTGSEPVADLGLAGFTRTLTVGNRAFFSGAGDQGLWVTDGTATGTRSLRSAGAFTRLHDVWGSGVLFWDGGSTYFTDGVSTRLLTSLARPVTLVRGNSQLLEVGGSIVHLDVSSGQFVTLLPRGALSFSMANALCTLGARLLFGAWETDAQQNTTAALFVTDGTVAGTTRLGAISASHGVQLPGTNTALILGSFVHVTDGTVAGTSFVTSIDGPIEPPSVVGNRVVWTGSVATVVSDGTFVGTHLLAGLPRTTALGVVNGELLLATRGLGRVNVHATLGTGATTRLVKSIPVTRGAPGVSTARIVRYGDHAYWLNSVATPSGLCTSDGTAAGTRALGIAAQQIYPATDRIYLRTADGGVASFDPTTATLTPVWPSAPGSAWEGAATFADHLAFAVRESGVARVFVSRSGAPAVPQLATVGTVTNLVAAQSRAFLTLTNSAVGLTTSLYAVDGLAAPSPLFAVNALGGDLVTLGARAQWSVGGLVVSDGTPAGTGAFLGPRWPTPDRRVLWDGAYFGWADPATSVLSRFDLAGDTSAPVATLPAGVRLAAVGATAGHLLVVGSGSNGGSQLFRYTSQVLTAIAPPNTVAFRPGFSLHTFGDSALALFAGSDAEFGAELWVTDGTASGTQRVADLEPGAAGSNPSAFATLGTKVLFVADTSNYGSELWQLPMANLQVAATAVYGAPCPGTPTVRLAASGRPLLGQSFDLVLDTATPAAPIALWFDLERAASQYQGCGVWSLGRLGFVAGQADGQGRASLTIDVPALSSLAGLSLFTQGLALVPQLQASAGLEVLLGAR